MAILRRTTFLIVGVKELC